MEPSRNTPSSTSSSAAAPPPPEPKWVAKMSNFAIQYNLTCASAALAVIRDANANINPSETPPPGAIPAEPAWASQFLLAAVFAGTLVGMLTMGYLGDKLGIQTAMILTQGITVLAAFCNVFVAPLWLGNGGGEGPVVERSGTPATSSFDPVLQTHPQAGAEGFYSGFVFARFFLGVGVGGMYPLSAASSVASMSTTTASNNEINPPDEPRTNYPSAIAKQAGKAFLWQTPGVIAPYLVTLLVCDSAIDSSGGAAISTSKNWSVLSQFQTIVGLGMVPCCLVLGRHCYAVWAVGGRRGNTATGSVRTVGTATAGAAQQVQPRPAGLEIARDVELGHSNYGTLSASSAAANARGRDQQRQQGAVYNPNLREELLSTSAAGAHAHQSQSGSRSVLQSPSGSSSSSSMDKRLLLLLIGSGGTWFLFDVSFYGTSVFAPFIIEKILPQASLQAVCWQTVLSNLVGVVGSLLSVAHVSSTSCRQGLRLGFVLLATAFFLFSVVEHFKIELPPLVSGDPKKTEGLLALILYYVLLVCCNFGPNVATYVLPMVCFPKESRVTYHGRSAACGKAGAFLGTLVYPLCLPVVGVPGIMGIQAVVSFLGYVIAELFVGEGEGGGEQTGSGAPARDVALVSRDSRGGQQRAQLPLSTTAHSATAAGSAAAGSISSTPASSTGVQHLGSDSGVSLTASLMADGKDQPLSTTGSVISPDDDSTSLASFASGSNSR
ncbi:unnamed protein product [Amoebophrya sp. A120]|nr:unnamed protein product [Amoebophrya sp. A120]|eukprot:GSA120T00022519001.1